MKIIYDQDKPCRLDRYLTEIDNNDLYSRNFIEKLIKDGKITVNSKQVKKSYPLNKGDAIDIEIPPPPDTHIKPESIPLEVIYEDDFLAVINKSAGISVHPAPSQTSGTIANAIINRFGNNLPHMDLPSRPGIVHRLDKNTSGLMIIAKDSKTLSRLSKNFSERKIDKFYKAIIFGVPAELEGTVTTCIIRDPKQRTRMKVAEQGREATTRYRIEKIFDFFSLADVMPVTGRTHQIRLHFDHLNCPVAGDTSYGMKKGLSSLPINLRKRISAHIDKKLKRHALHAYRLRFRHPMNDQIMDLKIDLPSDMKDFLNWLETEFESHEINWG